MSAGPFTHAKWRKSSRSGGNGGNCVEVACTQATIGLRDSKNPDGAVLAVDAPRFTAFIAAVRADRFTR